MSIFNIKIAASAQVTQAVQQMQALEASADSLAHSMQQAALASQGVNPKGYAAATRAMKLNSQVARDAAASTGMWATEQLKLNTAADAYNQKLAARKLSLKDIRAESRVASAAYREQLALQQMVVRSAGKVGGKELFDVYTPTAIHKSLDTTAMKFGFLREQIASASHQMVNWGKNTQWAGRQLMVGLTMPVAAFGAAAGVMAYQIEDELTRIQKVIDTNAQATIGDAESMKAVEKELAQVRVDSLRTAMKAAKDYAASGQETLEVQAELAAIGLKGQELQKQTNEVMRIATLGELDRQTSTEMAIALQSVWRMSNEELADSFNYLNAIENATSLSTQDFATAIPIAAAPMKAWGGDIRELGVLLTTMKERGIAAGKAGNAIKATMQRLGRPSKQVREEFNALTGESITELIEKGTSLTDTFRLIGEATEGLSDNDKKKAFAGLFGSYQVTTMMAMTEGVMELEHGIGQAAKAAEIAGQSTESWAETARMEIDRMMQSPSKQFKAQLEELKLNMAAFGEPFLVVGAAIIKAINAILKAFNAMPSGIKIVSGLTLGLLALAGPVIMLVGLFANLAGNLGKMFVALTRNSTQFKLLNKESAAAELAQKLAQRGFVNTGTQVEILTQQVGRLVQAMQAADAASSKLLKQPVNMGVVHGPGVAAAPDAYLPMAGPGGGALLDRQGNIITDQMVDDHKQMYENSKGINKSWMSTSKFMGAASLAMIAGQASSSEMGSNIANMAGAAFGVTGAISMLGIKLPKVNREATIGKVLFTGMAGVVKNMGSWIARIVTFLPRLVAGIHPIGWALAAVIGGWVAIRNSQKKAVEDQKVLNDSSKIWSRHLGYQREEWKKIGKLTSGVAEDTKTMAENAERLLASSPEIVEAYLNQSSEANRMRFAQMQYLTMRQTGATEAEALSGINQLFIAAGDSIDEANTRMSEFRDGAKSLEALGDTRKALAGLRAEMELLGEEKWLKERTDDFGFMGIQMLWEVPEQLLDSMFHDAEGAAYEAGAGAAAELENGLATMKNPFDRAQFLEDAMRPLRDRWRGLISEINQDTIDNLEIANIDTSNLEEMKKVIADAGTMGHREFMETYNASYNDFVRLSTLAKGDAAKLLEYERGLAEETANRLNLEGDAKTILGLQVDNAGELLGITKEQAETQYRGALEAKKHNVFTANELKMGAELSDRQRLQVLNQLRVNLGLRKTGELLDGFGPVTKKWSSAQGEVNAKLDEARRRAKQIAEEIKGWQIDAAKEAISSWQQAVADATLESFERRQERAMDAVEADAERRQETLESNQEAATERMDKRHEKAMRAMERRHEQANARLERAQEARRERIEGGFDSRIEKINDVMEAEQKAEDIRKRIFDAEMQRLDRLNEAANRNIDFNVALNSGDLDEAARIRNDMEAAATGWALSDADDAATRRAEKRTERLEGRIDTVEEAKDQRIEALEKVEEAEKKSLERRLEREKRFLDKQQQLEKERLDEQQEANRKALDNELDNTRKAEERKWTVRRRHLEKALDDFTGYIATSDKDLQRHIKIWEEEHRGLSLTTKGQFNRTADAINAYIKTSVTKAGKQIANEADWALNGWKIAKKMIRGAFGMSPEEFRSFIATGKPPKGYGKRPADKPQDKSLWGVSPYKGGKPPENIFTQFRHEGGEIGGVGGSRKGYARNMGMHRNEVPVIAEKGEYMVNKKAAAKNRGLLESINAGRNSRLNKGYGVGGAENFGMASMFGMMMAAALRRTVEGAIWKSGSRARNKWAERQAAGSYGVARAGVYGDTLFSSEQLSNAATIASVGSSMGMSNRDIIIGLMTAMQESMLRNINYGDRDSLGLFQQRPSMGWGTPAQVTNPEYAARKFFEGLKGIEGRDSMSMTLAAQAVQRSAYPYAYAKWEDEARAIFAAMDKLPSGEYTPGTGGWHKPSVPGKGWSNTHDYRNGIGSPLFAHSDGVVVESRAVTSGGSPGNGLYSTPYRSFGETIAIRGADGKVLRYAHLAPGQRFVRAGQRVKGGALIGRSGNTGNSTGPHTHFDVNGDYNALGYLKSRGISLKKGAQNVRWDNTIANLHKGEAVLTEDLNKKFHQGVDRFANGGEVIYNLNMNFGSVSDKDEIAQHVIKTIKRAEARKPQSRSNR